MKAKLAFCLFKYFPFGGLQSDFLGIATACQERGFDIAVYTCSWEGKIPAGFELRRVPVHARTNHGRARKFARWVEKDLMNNPVTGTVGFNRMPGLDIYFAADNCYAQKAASQRGTLYRLGSRYRTYADLEQAVFGPWSDTEVLLISERQKAGYITFYHTPEARLHLLPPGMDRSRRRPGNAETLRAEARSRLGLGAGDKILIQVGSGFITKGVDRSIRALAALPEALLENSRLLVVGRDRTTRFVQMAKRLGVADRVDFLGGRDDVPQLLLAADLMVHPAVNEAGGIVLLEALAAGLPVLCTSACGHAPHIQRSGGGIVLDEPFDQPRLNQALRGLLKEDRLEAMGQNGLAYAESTDLYSQHEKAADIIEQMVRRKI